MKTLLSIIIPCYNSEDTLSETLESVIRQDFQIWEAIIVNDGSVDDTEAIALKWLERDDRIKYFKKDNGGLGSARNFGIEVAIGKYILPLDSDNIIRPLFAQKAISILEVNSEIGVVYGNAMRFGSVNKYWNVGEFNVYKMLNHNYIDACSIIRKEVFTDVGLYDVEMPNQGHEDWDLWLRVMTSNFSFHYINEITFDYRVSEDSMIRSFTDQMLEDNIDYIQRKHYKLYCEKFRKLYDEHLYLIEKKNNTSNFKSMLKRSFRKTRLNEGLKYFRNFF